MLIVGVSFLSCDKDEIQHIPISSQADRIDWFVTSNDVFRLLESEEGLYFREEDNTKEILEKKSVGDESEHPLFYIINFKEGGFAIIAGDKRSLPILAYSKIGYFDLDSRIIPLGLLNWLEETAEKIRGLRTGKYKGLNETEQNLLWSKNSFDEIFHPEYYVEPIDPDDPCDDSYTIIKDPLLNSIWGQRRAFNDEIEFENCTAGTSPTGCVATAMGQVMRFHESPTVFNWSNMPLGPFGNNEIALLMEDIGDEVDMNYTCESSGSTMSNARSALKNEYGFSNAKLADYYSPTVKSNINNNKPVILAGYRKGEEHCFYGGAGMMLKMVMHGWPMAIDIPTIVNQVKVF